MAMMYHIKSCIYDMERHDMRFVDDRLYLLLEHTRINCGSLLVSLFDDMIEASHVCPSLSTVLDAGGVPDRRRCGPTPRYVSPT